MKANSIIKLAALTIFLFSTTAQAAVVNSADVGGFKTFTDTNTGRIWLDLDNFVNAPPIPEAPYSTRMTTFEKFALAKAQGFIIANESDLHQLLDSLPYDDSLFNSYAAIMGSGRRVQTIWGAYDRDPSNSSVQEAYVQKNRGLTSWVFGFSSNGNQVTILDEGVWAYMPSAVPEPQTYAMLMAGLSLIGFAARRKRTSA